MELRHISDINSIDTGTGCCFIYGSPPNHKLCDNPTTHVIASNLRKALVCDCHKDEIVKHHEQFGSPTVIRL